MGNIVRSLRLHGGLPGGTAVTLNNALKEICNVKMDRVITVPGGAKTVVGDFKITDFAGDDRKVKTKIQCTVFDDADRSVYSVLGRISDATKGRIVAGTAASKLIMTDDDGWFEYVLTNPTPKSKLYVECQQVGGPIIDCQEFDTYDFVA